MWPLAKCHSSSATLVWSLCDICIKVEFTRLQPYHSDQNKSNLLISKSPSSWFMFCHFFLIRLIINNLEIKATACKRWSSHLPSGPLLQPLYLCHHASFMFKRPQNVFLFSLKSASLLETQTPRFHMHSPTPLNPHPIPQTHGVQVSIHKAQRKLKNVWKAVCMVNEPPRCWADSSNAQ